MAYEENGFGTADGFDDDEFDDDSNLGFDDDEFELSDDDQEDEQQTSLAASDTEGFDDDDFYDEGADDFGSEVDLTAEGLSEPEPKIPAFRKIPENPFSCHRWPTRCTRPSGESFSEGPPLPWPLPVSPGRGLSFRERVRPPLR